MAKLNFDATSVDMSYPEALPTGVYTAIISNSEKQQCSSDESTMLVLTFKIISKLHTGRTLQKYLNINHTKAYVAERAQVELSSICLALGIERLTSVHELHNQPLLITVRTVHHLDGYQTNEIKAINPCGPKISNTCKGEV